MEWVQSAPVMVRASWLCDRSTITGLEQIRNRPVPDLIGVDINLGLTEIGN
jgi:hypothetical protein